MEENERIVNDILSSGPSSIEDPQPVSGGEVVPNSSPSVTLEEKHEEAAPHETVSSVEVINREEVPSRTPEIHNEDSQPVVAAPETHTSDEVNNDTTSHTMTEEPSSSHTEENTVIPPVESFHVEQPTLVSSEEVHERPLEESHTVVNNETETVHNNSESSEHHEEAPARSEDLGVTSADVHNVTGEHRTESTPTEVVTNTPAGESVTGEVQPSPVEVHDDHTQSSAVVNTASEVTPTRPLNEAHSENNLVNDYHDSVNTEISNSDGHHEEVSSTVSPVETVHSVETSTILSEPPKASADEELPKEKLHEESNSDATTPVNNTEVGNVAADQGSVTVNHESVNESHDDVNTHTEEQPPVASQPLPDEHHEEVSTSSPQPEESVSHVETSNPTVENTSHDNEVTPSPSEPHTTEDNTLEDPKSNSEETHIEEATNAVSQPASEEHHEETHVNSPQPEESVSHTETPANTVENSLPKNEATPSETLATVTPVPETHGLNSEVTHTEENMTSTPQPVVEEHHEEAPVTSQLTPVVEPHITETGVPETPRLTSENVEGPIRPEIPSPEDKKKEDETDKLKNIEENKAPSNDSAIVSPSTSEENESKEKKSKTAFDLFNEVDDDKLMYIIDRRLYDNGYQLSAFVTYIRYNSNHILDPDKKLYVLKMDNCITSNRYRSLSNKEGWKEALSYTGLDLEKMLNSGDYVFVTEEDYNKKIKKITERNANLSKVDKKDINYSTYENINRRRL